MDAGELRKRRETARALEAKGKVELALKMYQRIGALRDAARLLARLGRPLDAARILIESLGVGPAQVDQLHGEKRKDALLAANYLARAGQVQPASQLLTRLGEYPRAAELLERSGDVVGAQRLRERRGGLRGAHGGQATHQAAPEDAAKRLAAAQRLEREARFETAAKLYLELDRFADAGRCLERAGRHREAALAYVEGGDYLRAGARYLDAGEPQSAFEQLIRVDKRHPRYRQAAAAAVRLACDVDGLSFRLDQFLADFVAAGPADRREADAFRQLAGLYQRGQLLENAKDVLRALLSRFPDDAPARKALRRLEAKTRLSTEEKLRLSGQDERFRRAPNPEPRRAGSPDPSVGEFPVLPGLERATAALPWTGAGADDTRSRGDASPARDDEPLRPAAAGAPAAPPPGSQPGPPTREGDADTLSPAVGDGIPLYDAEAEVADTEPELMSGGEAGDARDSGTIVHPWATPEAPSGRLQNAFVPGAIIGERYRLLGSIGAGGAATVFRAKDLMLEEEIALKVINLPAAEPRVAEEAMVRFREELKVCRRLRHPNIVSLFDFGAFQGRYYITMELLHGSSLEELLEDLPEGWLPFDRGLDYLLQVCEGLQAAHEQGVIHRDLKPANLFVTEDGSVKVMDFGIAKNLRGTGVTATGLIAGTPEYMSPDQIDKFSQVTPASDLYNVGLVAYRMFAGRPPFQHDEVLALLMAHMQDEPEPPRAHRPDMPKALEKLILRLIDKRPERRPASCRELAAELDAIRATLGGA